MIPYPHIEMSEDGSPLVAGSRVPVRRLWYWHKRGVAVATLVRRYPQLGPAKVLTALAYAHDNAALIERDLAREDERVKSAQSPLPF